MAGFRFQRSKPVGCLQQNSSIFPVRQWNRTFLFLLQRDGEECMLWRFLHSFVEWTFEPMIFLQWYCYSRNNQKQTLYSYGLDLMSGKICAVWSLPIPTEKNCCGSQNKPQFVQATQKMSSLCGNRRKLILIPLIESVCFFLEKLLLMKTRKTQLLNNISCECVKLTLLFFEWW